MAYIGKSIESGTFSVLDTSGNTYNGSNVTFSLGTQVGSPAQLLVSHDGVIQKPGTDYTLATGGTQITFTTAPASGASIFIVEISGAVGGPLDSDLNGTELILDADGDTSITADTDDQIDIKIAGADDFKFSANAMNVLSGSTLTIDSGATITNSGTANGFGTDPDGAQVFNESGAAVDFRVEGDTDTHLLMVDGSSDNVGIGEDVPEGKLHIFTGDASVGPNAQADELVVEGSAHTGISILSGNDDKGNIYFGDSGDDDIGSITYHHDGNSMRFTTNASERIRILDDGDVAIGTTSTAGSFRQEIRFSGNPGYGMILSNSSNVNSTEYMSFRCGSTQEIGSIQRNGGADAIAFNTSSDYRLKQDIVDIDDGITRLKTLQPRKFKWKSDTSKTVDGFIAHEVTAVPESITGTKDETENKLNVVIDNLNNIIQENISESDWTKGKADGTFPSDSTWSASKTVPKYQQIDQAKLVPLLTAALKESVAKIEALEARVTTLEG